MDPSFCFTKLNLLARLLEVIFEYAFIIFGFTYEILSYFFHCLPEMTFILDQWMQFSLREGNSIDSMFEKINKIQEGTTHLKKVMNNPELTTFVAVCIPEFLSVYETERLVQELTVNEVDIYNIVVNQIVFPEEDSKCKQCLSRFNMQKKYINQVFELYEDFHVVLMPQEESEIRGVDRLQMYSQKLLIEKKLPNI